MTYDNRRKNKMIDIEKLADEIIKDHLNRKDRCETIPLRCNKFKHRTRPKTSIISEASKAYGKSMK
jgi:hypothetical protein